jgi:putative glycosyltransferase (TIGR04372 family)
MILDPGDVCEPAMPVPGSSADNPLRIMALLNSRAVGDTIFYQVFAGSVKRLFDHANLFVFMRKDRNYKIDLMKMNPEFDLGVLFDESQESVSIDNFQITHDITAINSEMPEYITNYKPWKKYDLGRQQLILSPSGMPEEMLSAFDDPATLRIPRDQNERLAKELRDHGVDDKSWFCVLNYREPGYQHRPSRPIKDQIPEYYQKLTEFIIDELGGQVVRVGHPSMTPFPSKKGFVDLAMLNDRFMLHAFAVTRARFLVASLSGIGHLGSAVGTPTLMTNCVSHPCSAGVWRDQDMALYLTMYTATGKLLSTAEQHDLGVFASQDIVRLAKDEGYQFIRNTPEEMAEAVKLMMDSTQDCQTWREPKSPEQTRRRPNRYEFPMSPKRRNRIVEFPELTRKLIA